MNLISFPSPPVQPYGTGEKAEPIRHPRNECGVFIGEVSFEVMETVGVHGGSKIC